MANTYTQLTIHCVFSVKGRENVLSKPIREKLFPYMSGILKNDGAFPLAVNGWIDHVHVLFECPPHLSVSDLMARLKSASSKWINDNILIPGKFQWQSGYGAFSCSRTHRTRSINYIVNQEQHHTKRAFKEEYLEILSKMKLNSGKNTFSNSTNDRRFCTLTDSCSCVYKKA
ncbi:MAG TPA: IS200/IS605 family transposase [Bacteroidia bacterium]|jgi:REP element-mobilizing transposase RayT|nr:IS200/IS605 family transposase [Bacteroidia bacterium]